MIKLAIDAMGGDYAPKEIVEGINLALKEYKNVEFHIFGNEALIKQHLTASKQVKIYHTEEFLDMGEKDPFYQYRHHQDVSLFKAMRFIKEGNAQGLVTAGPTQCVIVGGIFTIKRMPGMSKVAIAPIIPTANGIPRILLDCGANVDAKAEHLVEFSIYASNVIKALYNLDNAKVGLLNIGTEEGKGRDLDNEAYTLLQNNEAINFMGNIEPKEIFTTEANVLVSDGFTANIVLKTIEGTAKGIGNILKKALTRNLISKLATALFLKGSIRQFKKALDPNEVGGAMIIGLNSVVVKAHGSSDAYAFKNAIKQAIRMIKEDVIMKVEKQLNQPK